MRHVLLGLLAKEPAHGYELKARLEATFARLWRPINVGQIYVTLRRLERDGLVVAEDVSQDDRPDKRVFALTPQGREFLDEWLQQVEVELASKGQLLFRLVVAARVGADPLSVVDRHRREGLRRLRELHELAEGATDVVEALAVDGAILHLQADLRWLERCDDLLAGVAEEDE